MSKALLRIKRHSPSVLQGSFDFSGGRMFSLTAEHPLESMLFRLILAVIVMLLCGYFYFVSATVLNVIARKEAIQNISFMQTDMSTMEQRYFSLAEAITPAEAQDLGLKPLSNTAYVYRPGNTASAIMSDLGARN